ncbi:MAG: hypothetical protein IT270_18915 [Saprospiraceae bacterium]|nr:hypothetical protein [Saprospiraceae bacterium]
MRFFILFALFLASESQMTAQTAPRFTKTPIGNSGCSIYLPGKPDPLDISKSPDSSVVYTIETIDSTSGKYFRFGTILVDLKDMELAGIEEDMLVSYMDYLKTAFDVVEAAGYGKGHSLSTHPSAKGVLDYWKDSSGDEWVVKGWAAESTLFVMFVYGPEAYPNYTIVDTFFKGARFKGD